MVNAHGCCALTIESRVRKAFSVHEIYVPSVVPEGVEQPSAAVVVEQTTQSSCSTGHVLPLAAMHRFVTARMSTTTTAAASKISCSLLTANSLLVR